MYLLAVNFKNWLAKYNASAVMICGQISVMSVVVSTSQYTVERTYQINYTESNLDPAGMMPDNRSAVEKDN